MTTGYPLSLMGRVMVVVLSDAVQINVYKLGHAFLRFKALTGINVPNIDPCIYIHRFTNKLQLNSEQDEAKVSRAGMPHTAPDPPPGSDRRPLSPMTPRRLLAAYLSHLMIETWWGHPWGHDDGSEPPKHGPCTPTTYPIARLSRCVLDALLLPHGLMTSSLYTSSILVVAHVPGVCPGAAAGGDDAAGLDPGRTTALG